MEGRTRLAIGGMATVAASVTVICIVALTNSMALSESAGAPVDAAPVVIPASGTTSPDAGEPTPRATPKPTPSPDPVETDTSTSPPSSPGGAEVVPAPEAQVVTPTHPAPAAEQPAQPSRPSTPTTQEEAIAQAAASGSWAPVRDWAERQGWSDGRIDAFIAKLERAQGGDRLEVDGDRTSGSGGSGGRGGDQGDSGSERVQSPSIESGEESGGAVTGSSKERPANAGAGARDRSERPGHGAKRDRSYDSPERDDR